MRRSLIPVAISVATLAGCGAPSHPAPVADRQLPFPAARWVPESPSYVVSSASVGDGQDALRSTVETLLASHGLTLDHVAGLAHSMIGVDLLSASDVGALGVDLQGSMVVFSEDIAPTLVVHLSSPDAFAKFIATRVATGLAPHTTTIDGVAIATANVFGLVDLSWAVEHDWLWLHVGAPGEHADAWFAPSHRASGMKWGELWTWAQAIAHGNVKSPADVRRLLAAINVPALVSKLSPRLGTAAACVQRLAAVGHAEVSVAANLDGATISIALDIGDAARDVAGAVRPPPVGWAETAKHAQLAAELNLDVDAFHRWITPCAQALGHPVQDLPFGTRAARGFINHFDPDEKTKSAGAISIETAKPGALAPLLGEIPMRERLQRAVAFGSYKGFRVSVPFVATIDYVLDGTLGVVAIGEGTLDALGKAPTGGEPPPPLVELAFYPHNVDLKALAWLGRQLGGDQGERVARFIHDWFAIELRAVLRDTTVTIELALRRR